MAFSFFSYLAVSFALPYLVSAQLSGSVGPLTTTKVKEASKLCNVLDYGAVASQSNDIGPALTAAWADCKTKGMVYIPSGSFGMSTQVSLTGGSGTGIHMDGQIFRTGSLGSGTMISISNTNDFELYSANSKGAIQGNGFTFHAQGVYGPRILRLTDVTNFSVHDIALVDAGAFHVVFDTCENGEVYNMIIRGGNEGGLDGVDVWGTNIWIHDLEVSNKDECVTVKSPADHILVENIFCNWSGGCAIGSLGADTDISNVQYSNIYTWQSNQMFMIKSNGGSGTLQNCVFENFIGHENAYSLMINAFWTGQTPVAGNGVLYTDLTFNNWKGTCANGITRGPVYIDCPDDVPCNDITVENFAIWSDANNGITWKCGSAFGSGVCLHPDSSNEGFYSFATTTFTTAPAGFTAATMPGQLSTLPLTVSIPIPTIPTTFFPGATPISKLLGAAATGTSTGSGGSTGTGTGTGSGSGSSAGCSALFGQCGGQGWTGPTCCSSGTCQFSNTFYSQCLS